MKRKMKAVAALSLAAVMLLAGCGSSKGTQDGGSTTAADTAEQQEGTETAASDSGEKIVIRVVGPMEMRMIQQILLPSRQSEVTM